MRQENSTAQQKTNKKNLSKLKKPTVNVTEKNTIGEAAFAFVAELDFYPPPGEPLTNGTDAFVGTVGYKLFLNRDLILTIGMVAFVVAAT